MVIHALDELTAMVPMAGKSSHCRGILTGRFVSAYLTRFMDPAWGFAMDLCHGLVSRLVFGLDRSGITVQF